MSWQVLILLHALFSGLNLLQSRAIARIPRARHAALAVNAIALTTLYICGLFILPIAGKVNAAEFWGEWQLFLFAAIFFDLALLFIYKAMFYLESATVSVLATSSTVFGLLLAGILFSERLTTTQLIGSAMLLPCIWYVLMLARKNKGLPDFHNLGLTKGALYALIGSLALAFAHIIEKQLLSSASVGTYLAYGWLLQAVVAWVLFWIFGRRAKAILKDSAIVRMSIQLGILRVGAGIFFINALIKSNSVSLTLVIANFRIIIVAVLAGWLLGERNHYYKKLAAAAVSLIALSIIFWN